jgi:hypothetical protein
VHSLQQSLVGFLLANQLCSPPNNQLLHRAVSLLRDPLESLLRNRRQSRPINQVIIQHASQQPIRPCGHRSRLLRCHPVNPLHFLLRNRPPHRALHRLPHRLHNPVACLQDNQHRDRQHIRHLNLHQLRVHDLLLCRQDDHRYRQLYFRLLNRQCHPPASQVPLPAVRRLPNHLLFPVFSRLVGQVRNLPLLRPYNPVLIRPEDPQQYLRHNRPRCRVRVRVASHRPSPHRNRPPHQRPYHLTNQRCIQLASHQAGLPGSRQ